MAQHTPGEASVPASRPESQFLTRQCFQFLAPLLRDLHRVLDRRLVQTVVDMVLVTVMHRHRNSGLVLSELGSQLLGANRAPAGVKRIANLVHYHRCAIRAAASSAMCGPRKSLLAKGRSRIACRSHYRQPRWQGEDPSLRRRGLGQRASGRWWAATTASWYLSGGE